MPADPDPKSHYSYEEMMARLRESRGSQVRGEERVTDPETGKVTIRRRKRKRKAGKSGMLLREPTWVRTMKKVVYFGIPAAGGLIVLLYVLMVASVGTGVFQQGLGASLARQFHLPEAARVADTRLGGTTLSIGRVEGRGSPESPVKAFALEGTDARLRLPSFLGKAWDVEFCAIRRAGIRVGPAMPAAVAGAAGRSPLLGGGFLLSENPDSIRFDGFSVWDGMVLFGNEPEDKSPGLRGIRTSFSRREENGAVHYDGQITGGKDGRLLLSGWPSFRVESIRLQLHADHVAVLRSILRPAPVSATPASKPATLEPGVLEMAGRIPFKAGQTAELAVALGKVPVEVFLPRGMARVLSQGLLESNNLTLTWASDNPSGTWKLAGPASIDLAQLRGLTLIGALRQVTDGEIDEALDFDTCAFELEVSPEGTRIDKLQATAVGKCQLTGGFAVAPDGKLSGQLRLGVSRELLLGRIPNALKLAPDGFYWGECNLSGNLNAPVEDLGTRILSGGQSAAPPESGSPEPKKPSAAPAGTPDPRKADEAKLEALYRSLTGEGEARKEEAGKPPP